VLTLIISLYPSFSFLADQTVQLDFMKDLYDKANSMPDKSRTVELKRNNWWQSDMFEVEDEEGVKSKL